MIHAASPASVASERLQAGVHPPRLELEEWREKYGLIAGITGRADGFDLGLFTSAPAEAVLSRWLILQQSLAGAFRAFAVSRQMHSAGIRVHQDAGAGLRLFDGVDGHVTQSAGLALAVTVADCVPVYLTHPASGAVALLHAGWRGTAAGVLETGIRDLVRLTGGSIGGIVMHCGVSICADCYEVGPEVVEGVTGRRPTRSEHLDLRANLVARARSMGVSATSISPWCTAHHQNLFFSHRRSGGTDGRMVAYLGRPLD
ncbi:MAG: laccase domain-containing protein [Gemmatimonadetes bacterium]|nr:laccase domain-containing protein [Gemmatimonadota bacterium]